MVQVVRGALDRVCGCFPTGRHYPGIADRIATSVAHVDGLVSELDPSSRWSDAPLVAIDFETTGLQPESDRVIEVGAACFDHGTLSRLRQWLVNPGVPVSEEARKVHQIGDDELTQAPPFGHVLAELVPLLEGRVPVAYNAAFDRKFLQAECRRAGFALAQPPPALRSDVVWIDPLVWVRELERDQAGNRLTEVCERMGITLEQAHRAAGDAEAAGRVLLGLANRMPARYGELIRLQGQYAVRQDVDFTAARTRPKARS
ncbi:MAG: 3'-5' exonuclease [Proteobacteria bacterium]|nr:3'-5' exonuclease [Pseudomonadota bacterium]